MMSVIAVCVMFLSSKTIIMEVTKKISVLLQIRGNFLQPAFMKPILVFGNAFSNPSSRREMHLSEFYSFTKLPVCYGKESPGLRSYA